MSVSQPRRTALSPQQLYQRGTTRVSRSPAESRARRPSTRSPAEIRRSNSAAATPHTQQRSSLSRASVPSRSSKANGRESDLVSFKNSVGTTGPTRAYVADINSTFCVDAAVRCVEVINERIVWTAEFDGTLQVRSLPKGSAIKQIPGRDGTFCTCLLYLPATQKVWAGYQDGYLRIYDAVAAELEREVKQHSGAILCIIAVEGTVYTGGQDWKIAQWNPTDATFERLFAGHSGSVRALCCYEGPTGAVLFSGSDDGTIKAWDPYSVVPEGEGDGDHPCLHTFTGHDRAVLALTTIPQANMLWSGGEDGTVRVWNLTSLTSAAVLTGHRAPVSAFLVVESRVWSADGRGRILVWDINSFGLLQDISNRLRGLHLGHVFSLTKVQPVTAWRVWSTGSTGFVQCWNAETSPIVFEETYKFAGRGFKSTMDELMAYTYELEEELESCRRDGDFNVERARLEVQRELEIQQLLAEENERLRSQLNTSAGHPTPGADRPLLTSKDGQPPAANPGARPGAEKGVSKDRSGSAAPSEEPAEHAPSPQPSSRPATAMNGQTSSFVFGAPAATTTTPLRREFDGEDWGFVLLEKPHELRSVFRDEASAALGVPTTRLSNIRFELGSLIASLTVTHPSEISGDEMRRRMDAYDFPLLAQLGKDARRRPKVDQDAAEERIKELEKLLGDQADTQRDGSQSPPVAVDAHHDNGRMTRDLENMERELGLLRSENDALLRILERDQSYNSDSSNNGGSADPSGTTRGDSSARQKDFEKLLAIKDEDIRNLIDKNAALKDNMRSLEDSVDYLNNVVSEKEEQRASLEKQLHQLQHVASADREAGEVPSVELSKSFQEDAPSQARNSQQQSADETPPPATEAFAERSPPEPRFNWHTQHSSIEQLNDSAAQSGASNGQPDKENSNKHLADVEAELQRLVEEKTELQKELDSLKSRYAEGQDDQPLSRRDEQIEKEGEGKSVAKDKDEVPALQKKLEEAEQLQAEHKESLRKAQDEIAAQKKKTEEQSKQSEENQKNLKEIQAQLGNANTQNQDLNKQLEKVKKQLDDTCQDLTKTKEHVEELENELKTAQDAQSAQDTAQSQQHSAAQADSNAQKKQSDLQAKLDALKKELDNTKKQLADKDAELQQMRSDASNARDGPRGLSEHGGADREDYEALEKYMNDRVKPMLSQLQRQVAEQQIDIDRLQGDTTDEPKSEAHGRLSHSPQSTAEFNAQIDVLKRQLADAKQQLDEVSKAHKDNEKNARLKSAPPGASHRQEADKNQPQQRSPPQVAETPEQLDDLKEKLASAEKERDAAMKELDAVSKKLSDAHKSQQDSAAQADSNAQKKQSDLQAKLDALKKELDNTKKQLADKDAELQQMRSDASNARDGPRGLSEHGGADREDYEALEKYMNDRVKPMLSQLQRQVAEQDIRLGGQDHGAQEQEGSPCLEDAARAEQNAQTQVREAKIMEAVSALKDALEKERENTEKLAEALGAKRAADILNGKASPAEVYEASKDQTTQPKITDVRAESNPAASGEMAPSNVHTQTESPENSGALTHDKSANSDLWPNELQSQNSLLSSRLREAEEIIAKLQDAFSRLQQFPSKSEGPELNQLTIN